VINFCSSAAKPELPGAIPETPGEGNPQGHSKTKRKNAEKTISLLRKRNSRLKQQVRKSKSQQKLSRGMKFCKQKSPMMYEWLQSQIQRFQSRRTPYNVLEKTTALTLIYSCGVNGYK